jgi:hypothetical protein
MRGKVTNLVWLAVGVVVCVVAFAFLRYFRGSTVYVSNESGGYTAYGASETATLVSKDRYDRILQSFIRRDIFDILSVGRVQDDRQGLGMLHDHGKILIMTSFLRLKNPEKITSFRDAMKKLGYVPSTEHPWNVGLGEDMESLSLYYQCEAKFEPLRDISNHALTLLDAKPITEYFVSVSRSDDMDFSKFKVVPRRKLLDELP